MDNVAADAAGPARASVYYDGTSSRRWMVNLAFNDQLEITGENLSAVSWAYSDLPRVDGLPGVVRVSCLSAPPLARLEIRDASLAAELASRCPRLGEYRATGVGAAKIVGWSLAAAVSIVLVVLFAIPLAADR